MINDNEPTTTFGSSIGRILQHIGAIVLEVDSLIKSDTAWPQMDKQFEKWLPHKGNPSTDDEQETQTLEEY